MPASFSLRHQALVCLLLACLCAVCIAAYWPGLAGTFLFDDYPNLSALGFDGGVYSSRDMARFVFTNDSGVLGRPVSMVSFLINDNGWPSNAASFKYTNLLIHMLCGVLVFVLARGLADLAGADARRALYVALLCAALWLLHPLHVSTVLYVIQRMTQLTSLFTLAGLLCYLAGRRRIATAPVSGSLLLAASMLPFGLLAVLAKENGILICAYILVIEFTLVAGTPRPGLLRLYLLGAAVAPLVLLAGYIGWNWTDLMRSYAGRDFTLTERLLTEPRVLADYIRLILAYRPWGTGLLHDDFPISSGLLSPISTLACLLGVVAALAAAALARRRYPVLAFAVLWFLAGHTLESTALPLELYFEHRNYLPMLGPLFALAWYAARAVQSASDRLAGGAITAAVIGVLGLMSASLASTARTWGDPMTSFAVWEVENPTSVRAKRMAATFFDAAGDPATSVSLLEEVALLAPEDSGARVQALDIACRNGMPLPWSVEALTSKQQGLAIRDGTTIAFDGLTENVLSGECDAVSKADLVALVDAIGRARNAQTEGRRMATLRFREADVHMARGDLNATMRALEQTWALQPTTSVAISIVSVLHSAGLDAQAAEWMARAREADARRPALAPSRLGELDAYARRLGVQ